MNEDIAIKVDGIYKDFLLPHEKADSIKSAFTGILKGKKGHTIEKQHALKDISLEIKKGEFFGIVGRNGSGKSTLLKILAGIYQPTKGKVSVSGRLVPFIELGVGFNPELTGRENVYLSAALLGFAQKEVDSMYTSIVEFAELEKFMDQKLKNYSSGMQVRLAFSVAIRADADILLIDEVLAVGDEAFQRKCFKYFKQLKDENKTVIFVSHDMDSVKEYCSRALLIEDGVVKAMSADVKTIAANYSRLFIDKTKVSNNTESRFGSGELTIENIKQQVSKDKITINFDVVNNTKNTYKDVIVGININNNNDLVTGNNTRFIEEYSDSLTMSAKEKKHIKLEFDNLLSKNNYTTDLSLALKGNIVQFDTILGATKIKIPNPDGSSYYKIQIPLSVSVSDIV